MDEKNKLTKAINNNEVLEFLKGEGEYLIESSQYSPEAGQVDIGKVLSKGVYQLYKENSSIKKYLNSH